MNMKKILAFALCLVLVAGLSIGGTLAWITANSEQVVNTFTYGDINVELKETTTDYKMIPGKDIAKDPKVTVKAGSEACWLFVKVDKSSNYSTYLENYTVAEGWSKLETAGLTPAVGENSDVYYREVTDAQVGTAYAVLGTKEGFTDGYVTVKTDVTKEDFAEIGENNPTLTFKAYAVQRANVDDAETAWGYISQL